MILERLRSETKAEHQALEKLIVYQIKKVQNNTDYIQLLELFYGYFKPVEQLLDMHLSNEQVPFYTERRKADRLLNDINEAGGQPSMNICHDLPSITNSNEALGAMYVLEGSTLGGKIISKMIMQHLFLSSDASVTFFNGYGQNADKMWSSFTEALDRHTDSPEAQSQIARAANQTFIKFKNWVERKTLPEQN